MLETYCTESQCDSRYPTNQFAIKAQLFKADFNPVVGQSYIMSGLNGNTRLALGVTIELFPLQVGTTPDSGTDGMTTTSTTMTTTDPLPPERG